jgi:hypothetical protein
MIDFTSLFIIAGIVFGLLAGDAAIYGDTLRVQIAVAESLRNAGFTEASAESVFMAEAARIVRGESIIPAPSLRVNSSPSVVTALAKPLNLDTVVAAIQNQLGIDHLQVSGAVLAEAGTGKMASADPVRALTSGVKLDMIVVVVQPRQTPVQTVLEQPDGDATALVKRGAGWAMEQVSPFRVVLAHFLAGIQGDQEELHLATIAATRFLDKPWEPSRSSERALTRNVLALLAMLDNKIADAGDELDKAEAVPDVLPQARAEIALNHSFLAVIQRRPDEAARLLNVSREQSEQVDLPGFASHLELQEGLIAWSAGNVADAEEKFREVIAALPNSETAHHYLARLLRAKGDAAGAAAEEQAERISHRFDTKGQDLAVVLFWADPVKGGVTRRQ